VRFLTKSRSGGERSRGQQKSAAANLERAKTFYLEFNDFTYLLYSQVGGRRGQPPLSHFDGHFGEARELVFPSEDHLFRLGYSDLVLQGFELGARDVNVEARCVDKLEEISMDLGGVPKV
jgi:hypothetical protein